MRIAVWNTAWLGDAVLTLPLIQHIKQHFPQAAIDYYVRAGLGELFECHPAIERVIEFDKKKLKTAGTIKFGKALADCKYSIWISAHQSLRSSIIAHFTQAPFCIGYDSGLVSRLVYSHTVERSFYNHEEIERLLKLAVPLGFEIDFDNPSKNWPILGICPKARARADQIWLALDPATPVLGIHPGSVWPTKRWPADYFAKVARLASKHGVQIMLFSGPNEQAEAQAVREVLGDYPGFTDLAGKLGLAELAACLGRLNCYLTNDSGPMHLAWVQKTPTVAVFGPTTRELGFFPRGEHSTVLELNLRCRPCGLHGHKKCPKKHHACMRDISPRSVWAAVAEKLGLPPAEE